MDPFYRRENGLFVSTVSTRGPWDERLQHGGPPSALLLRAMTRTVEEAAGAIRFAPARLTTEFVRTVPIVPLEVEVDPPQGGRTAQRVRSRLRAEGRVVMEGAALFVRQDPDVHPTTLRRPGTTEADWPAPDTLARFVFPFFTTDEGYHQAVDLRFIDTPWGTTPVRCWARPLVDLVDDEPLNAYESVVILADAESGMGPPLDPSAFHFANPDLTVYFARAPDRGFVGYDIRSQVGDSGVGLAESALRDARGVFGRSAQSLVVAPR